MRHLISLAAVLIASPTAAADRCFDESPGSTYAQQIQPLFDAYCVACHQDRSPAAGLSLQSGTSARALPNAMSGQNGGRLVKPGDPLASYLYRKLIDTHKEVGGGGARMPLAGIMSKENSEIVRQWIASCAKQK